MTHSETEPWQHPADPGPAGPPPPPRRGGRQRPRALAAGGAGIGALVVIVLAIGLAAASHGKAPSGGGAAAVASTAPQLPRPVQLPAPEATVTGSQLQALLKSAPLLPATYKPYGGVFALEGFGQDPPPTRLTCTDLAQFAGALSIYDKDYAQYADLAAIDPGGDLMYVEVLEAATPAGAASDVAALRAGGLACPGVQKKYAGSFRVAVREIPGLGGQNVELHMTPDGGASPVYGPPGPADILLIQDGRYLVDVNYALHSPAGQSHKPGLPPSVMPPSITIADAVLTRL